METQILKTNNFRAEVRKRERLISYPSHLYQVFYIKETPKGKNAKEKILKNYVYKTYNEALLKAKEFINNIEKNLKLKEEEKRKKAEANKLIKASDFYEVGDIIVNSWGYEQTNIEFYKVVSVKNKTIEIKEVYQIEEENSMYSHGMSCNVLPSNNFVENGDSYLLRVKLHGYLSNPASYYYMHKWDGKPKYKSWYY